MRTALIVVGSIGCSCLFVAAVFAVGYFRSQRRIRAVREELKAVRR